MSTWNLRRRVFRHIIKLKPGNTELEWVLNSVTGICIRQGENTQRWGRPSEDRSRNF